MKQTTMKETKMKIVMAMMMTVTVASTAMGGSLDPAAGPAPTMRTLDEIYNRLEQLTAVDPAAAAPEQVLAGRTYGDASTSTLDVRTGTMPNRGAGGTITPGTADQTLEAGYYSGATTVSGDADLVADNIKKDVVIFGVTGTLSGGGGQPWKTGQKTSYRTGDDGTYQKGQPSFQDRFTDNGNETITDNMTGLIWTKSGYMAGEKKNWHDAIDYCEGLTHAGASDWRLPNNAELLSLLERGVPPGVFTSVQLNLPGGYWSSTTVTDGNDAWFVAVRYGSLNWDGKSSTWDAGYVWPVRGGN